MRNLHFSTEKTTLNKMKIVPGREQLGEYAEKFRIAGISSIHIRHMWVAGALWSISAAIRRRSSFR